MTVILSRQHRRQLLDFAEEAGSSECCGLILGRGDTVEILELTANVAFDPFITFEIDPSALIRAESARGRAGWKYWAIFTRIQMVRLNRPKPIHGPPPPMADAG